ncbi:hypothetical protein Taro_027321 [Colocasia esculenta]|uniref:Peptidase A1 domain-containing protein n=1 Tax=Colocasia esculenta TaxID=4460 RepID=A0A843VR94_COLES|nr:hypothetical protein [Colocasia esculenta]
MAACTFHICLFSLIFCSCGILGEDSNGTLVDVGVDTLRPDLVCSPSEEAWRRRNTLQILRRQGPCYPDRVTKPDHRQALARVHSINARLSSATRSNGTLLQGSKHCLPVQSGSGDYIVTLSLGTPKSDQMVEIDTGSDLCWIQCKPCSVSCFPQQQPPFDPSASSSYSNISCTSAPCRPDLGGSCSSSSSTCLYSYAYEDGSATGGILATETLTVTPSTVFPSFVFGCGHNNRGTFLRETGLFGLGRSPYSLVSQVADRLGNVFSYCLPAKSSTGYLTLGNMTAAASSAVLYTPMLTDARDPTVYFIDLIGISVGDRRLPVPPAVFRSSGTIVDSGTTLAYLPPPAYTALRSAFRSAMSKYSRAPPRDEMDTCYDFSKAQTVSYPPITLHYDGADITLGFVNVFYIDDDVSQVCLAFTANTHPGEVGIIGNIQQRTFEVTYDIGENKIGFTPGACS